jgi:hypothetical protein
MIPNPLMGILVRSGLRNLETLRFSHDAFDPMALVGALCAVRCVSLGQAPGLSAHYPLPTGYLFTWRWRIFRPA